MSKDKSDNMQIAYSEFIRKKRSQYINSEAEKLVEEYRKKSNFYRKIAISFQLTVIFLSTAITSLSGGWLDQFISQHWLIPALSAIISILTSINLFFKFKEKGSHLQETADKIDLENSSFSLGIGDYKKLTERDATSLFIERIEFFRKEQLQRQQQLDQASLIEKEQKS